MEFVRFDICDAYYLFLSQYHEGQGSNKYLRLCKMQDYYKPPRNLIYASLSVNGKYIYNRLVKKEMKNVVHHQKSR